MQLSRHQLAALNAVAANRAYMARTGLTYSGQRLWTPKEIGGLQLYPDYRALVRALPGRTRKAIESKVWRCGLAKPLRIWSEAEFGVMKRLYVRGVPMRAILSLLPGKTARQVWSKASSRNIWRPRRPPQPTGFAAVDAIRRRAFDLHISMTDLSVIAGRRNHFQSPRKTDWSAVQRVLPHLGGQTAIHIGMTTRPIPCRSNRRMKAASTPKGGSRWSKAEDAVVRGTYPDYTLMRRRLPSRSLVALKHRAAVLGVVQRRRVWTQTEVRKLSRLVAANTSNAELALAFPYLRPGQITAKIRHLRLPRRKPNLASFEDEAISEVRRRAVEKGLSLRELDRLARTKRYFQKSTRRLMLEYVARATVVLGGEIRIEWEDI